MSTWSSIRWPYWMTILDVTCSMRSSLTERSTRPASKMFERVPGERENERLQRYRAGCDLFESNGAAFFWPPMSFLLRQTVFSASSRESHFFYYRKQLSRPIYKSSKKIRFRNFYVSLQRKTNISGIVRVCDGNGPAALYRTSINWRVIYINKQSKSII